MSCTDLMQFECVRCVHYGNYYTKEKALIFIQDPLFSQVSTEVYINSAKNCFFGASNTHLGEEKRKKEEKQKQHQRQII